MPTLYILCGIPASGKTTWSKKFLKDNFEQDIRYVSRDDIRFSLLKDGEDYFSHEAEVFKKFSNTLAQTLVDGFDVIADATHINRGSREKLTSAIDKFYTQYQIIYVIFNINITVCQLRNFDRQGIKHVPSAAIQTMYERFQSPTLDEDERAMKVVMVNM